MFSIVLSVVWASFGDQGCHASSGDRRRVDLKLAAAKDFRDQVLAEAVNQYVAA